MFQQDSQNRALTVNHGDAATGEEHLWGIVFQFIVSSVGLLASELLILHPLSADVKILNSVFLKIIHPCDCCKNTVIN